MNEHIEIYDSDIDYYLQEYIETRELDRNKIPSSQWAAAMRYVHNHVFTGGNSLRQKNTINNEPYNMDAVEQLLDKYIFLCMDHCQRICTEHFCLLSGLTKATISYWANDVRRADDPRAKRIYKTLLENSVMSADDLMISRNGVNSIAYSNRIHAHYDAFMSKQESKTAIDVGDLAERLGITDRIKALPDKEKSADEMIEVESDKQPWMAISDDFDID